MAGDVVLKLVLQKLSSFESKVEGALEKSNSLESSLQGEITTLTAKTSVVNDDKSVGEMDNSLRFLNEEIEGLKSKANEKERD